MLRRIGYQGAVVDQTYVILDLRESSVGPLQRRYRGPCRQIINSCISIGFYSLACAAVTKLLAVTIMEYGIISNLLRGY